MKQKYVKWNEVEMVCVLVSASARIVRLNPLC